MSLCTPKDRWAGCNMKRTGSMSACRDPGGCIAPELADGLPCGGAQAAGFGAEKANFASENNKPTVVPNSADEAALATFFADPRFKQIRHLVEQVAPGSVAPIEAVVERVRREVWRDLS